MNNFSSIQQSYHQLLDDLNSDNISPHVSYLAKEYFIFTKSVNHAFTEKDFSSFSASWNKFEEIFENKRFNFISVGLHIGDMDYPIKKSYLNFLLSCQQFVADIFLDTLVNDLALYEQNKNVLPPFIYFYQWFEHPHKNLKLYLKKFSQEHFNFLASFKHMPEYELFINSLFLRSKKEYDKNSFDNEYFLFNIENLQTLINNKIYADVLLKNNQLNLPEDFIDYIKFSAQKLSDKPLEQQSQLEQKELQEFFILYQKQKFDYLFPAKNIKTKTNKI